MDNRRIQDKELLGVLQAVMSGLFPTKQEMMFQIETLKDEDTMYENDQFARITMFLGGDFHAFSKFYRRKYIESFVLLLVGLLQEKTYEDMSPEAIKETVKLLEWVIRKKNYYLYRRLTGEQNALRMADDKSYIMAFIDEFVDFIQQTKE
jgi:hypothetical protein